MHRFSTRFGDEALARHHDTTAGDSCSLMDAL
jgi:hypothetical protein